MKLKKKKEIGKIMGVFFNFGNIIIRTLKKFSLLWEILEQILNILRKIRDEFTGN